MPANISLIDIRQNEKYRYFDFEQTYKGLKVHDSRLYIKTTRDNELVVFGLDVYSDIDIDIQPGISKTDAINSASAAISSTINNAIVKEKLKIH